MLSSLPFLSWQLAMTSYTTCSERLVSSSTEQTLPFRRSVYCYQRSTLSPTRSSMSFWCPPSATASVRRSIYRHYDVVLSARAQSSKSPTLSRTPRQEGTSRRQPTRDAKRSLRQRPLLRNMCTWRWRQWRIQSDHSRGNMSDSTEHDVL